MKKFIGLDVGDVRIGVAKCDPLGILATALEVIDRTKTNPVGRIKEVLTARKNVRWKKWRNLWKN